MDPVRHSAYVVAVGRHARVACSAFFLATTLAVGCVSLDKPTSVQKCVAAGNCSDNPNPQPGPDANPDAVETGPDSRSEDKPTTKEDLASDSPIPDAPADQADQGPDQKDVAGTDGKGTDISADVDSGLSPADQRDIAGTDGPETGSLGRCRQRPANCRLGARPRSRHHSPRRSGRPWARRFAGYEHVGLGPSGLLHVRQRFRHDPAGLIRQQERRDPG